MKRAVLYTAIFIAGLVLQFGWMSYFAVWGVTPNFILGLLLCIGLTRGSFTGQLMGFAWGLSWDAMSVDLFGSHALLFTVVGYFSGLLSRKWNESKVITQMVLTGIASMLYLLGVYLLAQIFGSGPAGYRISYIDALQPICNMLVAPILFGIVNGLFSYFNLNYEY